MADSDKPRGWLRRSITRVSTWINDMRASFGISRDSTKGDEMMRERLGVQTIERPFRIPEAPEAVRGQPFEPLSARVYYSPKLNRYVDRDSGRMVSYEEYTRELALWRTEHLDFIVALTNPNTTASERAEIRKVIEALREDEALSKSEREESIGALLGS